MRAGGAVRFPDRARRPPAPAAVLGLGLLFLGPASLARADPKTDVVVLRNGDRMTCEIKRLARGKLEVKTDDMGTIDIEWDKIESVTATGHFEIEDLRGRLFFGPLETIPDEGLQVATATGIDTVPLLSVVRIMAIKASFWKRLSGRVDVGFAYTKSNELVQFNGEASVKFTRPTFTAQLEASSLIQRQQSGSETTRNSSSFSYTRSLENRRFAVGRLSADQNRELGYELRAGIAGAWGQYLLRRQGNEISGAAGLYINREIPVDGANVDNLEALVGLDWANFSYEFPKTDIDVGSVLIVGLTDWGRYRVDLNARLDRELFSDLHLVLKGYFSYDSQPPTEGASKADYQASLALGYTF